MRRSFERERIGGGRHAIEGERKMKKYRVLYIFLAAAAAALLIVGGIFLYDFIKYPKRISFSDFPQFSGIEEGEIGRFRIYWDTGDGSAEERIVSDGEAVQTIAHALFHKTVFERTERRAGNLSYMVVETAGEKEYRVGLYMNVYGDSDRGYKFSDGAFRSLLAEYTGSAAAL